MKGKIEYLTYQDACSFLLPRHYSGRRPVISLAFGWFIDGELKAVCSFGKPASPSLCKGIMNGEFVSNVYELNRLCRVESLNEQLSQFVSACLRRISINNWIVVSYADSGMNHNGYIYQACNFIYTGATKKGQTNTQKVISIADIMIIQTKMVKGKLEHLNTGMSFLQPKTRN